MNMENNHTIGSSDQRITDSYLHHSEQRRQQSDIGTPHQSTSVLRSDNEPWKRPPPNFELANLLNRNFNTPQPQVQQFSLPSLNTFGKKIITKQDHAPTISRGVSGQQPVRSIMSSLSHSHSTIPLNTKSINTEGQAYRSLPLPTRPQQQVPTQSSISSIHNQSSPPRQPLSPINSEKSISKRKSPKSNTNSRRLAPAPAEDDENDVEEEISSCIRGGRWTPDEHERFLAGFRIHGHKWKRVQQVVCSRSVTQVRTHAQKYLLKLAKHKADKKEANSSIAGKDKDDSSSDHDTSQTSSISGRSPTKFDMYHSSEQEPLRYGIDNESVLSSTPHYISEQNARNRSPWSKSEFRRNKRRKMDTLDEEYIAAAAQTLCFLMHQEIASLIDDQPPYDNFGHVPTTQDDVEHPHKRSYIQFLADADEHSNQYGFKHPETQVRESGAYNIQGKKLCS